LIKNPEGHKSLWENWTSIYDSYDIIFREIECGEDFFIQLFRGKGQWFFEHGDEIFIP
jgi:hypothetical protein